MGMVRVATPSPAMQITSRSGWTDLAAMAAGKPYPIAPLAGATCVRKPPY